MTYRYQAQFFKFFTVLLLTLISIPVSGFAQKDDLIFEQFNTSHGLSNNEIHAVLQDKKGFLWIATADGLNRYDGYNFKIYRNDPQDSSSIAHNTTWFLSESKDGKLWIGTEKGLSLYNRVNDNFTNYEYQTVPNVPAEAAQWANVVLSIHEDDEGILWLGTVFKGLTRFDPKSGQFSHFLPDSSNTDGVNVALWVDNADPDDDVTFVVIKVK